MSLEAFLLEDTSPSRMRCCQRNNDLNEWSEGKRVVWRDSGGQTSDRSAVNQISELPVSVWGRGCCDRDLSAAFWPTERVELVAGPIRYAGTSYRVSKTLFNILLFLSVPFFQRRIQTIATCCCDEVILLNRRWTYKPDGRRLSSLWYVRVQLFANEAKPRN